MFTLHWKVLNVPSGPTICPSTCLPFNPLPANMVKGRKDALLLINEWSYFAIYYLSPQYRQALVIHEIQASNLFIRENNDFFSLFWSPL